VADQGDCPVRHRYSDGFRAGYLRSTAARG
jgi:hypothetical protein